MVAGDSDGASCKSLLLLSSIRSNHDLNSKPRGSEAATVKPNDSAVRSTDRQDQSSTPHRGHWRRGRGEKDDDGRGTEQGLQGGG
jgi:hypothetical protein